jgi:hypothetical protein
MFPKRGRPSISSLEARLEDDENNFLRKRITTRDNSEEEPIDRLQLDEDEMSDNLSEEEDIPGCPLPSTPEDSQLLEAEVSPDLENYFVTNF